MTLSARREIPLLVTIAVRLNSHRASAPQLLNYLTRWRFCTVKAESWIDFGRDAHLVRRRTFVSSTHATPGRQLRNITGDGTYRQLPWSSLTFIQCRTFPNMLIDDEQSRFWAAKQRHDACRTSGPTDVTESPVMIFPKHALLRRFFSRSQHTAKTMVPFLP